jgi:diaminopimelate decarboxylase
LPVAFSAAAAAGRTNSPAAPYNVSSHPRPTSATGFKQNMDYFHYRDRVLHCEEVPVPTLAAAHGTPLYVYSRRTLLHHLTQLKTAFAAANPLICYSLKTNPNVNLCRLMGEHGAGFDVTSGGELYRALAAGGAGDRIVFAGVGKTDGEMRYALDNGVFLFNVESEGELLALADVANSVGKVAQVALRVNPDLPPKTHAKDGHLGQGGQVRAGH